MCKTTTTAADNGSKLSSDQPLGGNSFGFLPSSAAKKEIPSFQKPSKFFPTSSSNNKDSPKIAWTDFLNPNKPWVLVPNGSFNGVYDFVPRSFRVGPWNILCCLYLAALVYAVAMLSVECFSQQPPASTQAALSQYYPAFSWQWWYNALTFAWTMRVSYTVIKSDLGIMAWASYTLQSWTLIVLRHGLSTLAPFYPSVAVVNERLRFPMLAQATITFGIWNFVLVPAFLMYMQTSHAKQGFLQLVTSFLLTQLHVFNLVFAAIGGVWGTPMRELDQVDFCLAMLFMLQYILFYLFIMDRLGVHYYFIFSPRTPLALLTWSLLLGMYFGGFSLWKGILVQYGSVLQ